MSDSGVISITPKDAWQLLQDNPKAVLIDTRSEMEYLFIGHSKGAIHIPILKIVRLTRFLYYSFVVVGAAP